MASFTFNNFEVRRANGLIGDLDALSYKYIFVGPGYSPSKANDVFRSSITDELSTGGGYTAGGITVTPTIVYDSVNNRIDLNFSSVNIDPATFNVAGAVLCIIRGGAASADELVAFNDFGGTRSPNGVPFSIGASTLRLTIG